MKKSSSATVKAGMLAIALAAGSAVHADPDPDALRSAMQDALVPATAQLARVTITVQDQEAQARKSWEALVARRRFDDGPRTAIDVTAPAGAAGTIVLTAPHADGSGRGLWVYAPADRRVNEIAPLEATRRFLSTDFDFADLALAERPVREVRLLGSEEVNGDEAWKIEAVPSDDWPYSRVVTWIAEDTKLPLRREYFDRADRLWQVVTYRNMTIDAVPTVVGIIFNDVQTRSRSEWRVHAVSYDGKGIDRNALSPAALGELPARAFWAEVNEPAADSAAHTAAAQTGESAG